MRILVHLCCGPCGITVLQRLKKDGHDLCGLFFNPNIQPLAEYMRRREGALQVAERLDIPLLCADALPEEEQAWTDPWLEQMKNSDSQALDAASGRPSPPPAADPALWLKAVAGREKERCVFCWRTRLRKSAALAASRGFEGFTSSLLYSRHQNHEAIRNLGEEAATACGTVFAYQDHRSTWQEGIRISKEWGIFRQQYCGCIFSEYERYSREFSRLRAAGLSPI